MFALLSLTSPAKPDIYLYDKTLCGKVRKIISDADGATTPESLAAHMPTQGVTLERNGFLPFADGANLSGKKTVGVYLCGIRMHRKEIYRGRRR